MATLTLFRESGIPQGYKLQSTGNDAFAVKWFPAKFAGKANSWKGFFGSRATSDFERRFHAERGLISSDKALFLSSL